jgi:hypothetical protein
MRTMYRDVTHRTKLGSPAQPCNVAYSELNGLSSSLDSATGVMII